MALMLELALVVIRSVNINININAHTAKHKCTSTFIYLQTVMHQTLFGGLGDWDWLCARSCATTVPVREALNTSSSVAIFSVASLCMCSGKVFLETVHACALGEGRFERFKLFGDRFFKLFGHLFFCLYNLCRGYPP